MLWDNVVNQMLSKNNTFLLKIFRLMLSESTSTAGGSEVSGELDEEVSKVKEIAKKLLQTDKSLS